MIDYEASIVAADEILLKVYGIQKAKLNPLKDKDFLKIVERLAKKLDKIAGPSEAKAVTAALNSLDIDWTKASAAQVNKAIKAAQSSLSLVPVAVMGGVAGQLTTSSGPLVAGTRLAALKRHKLKIGTAMNKLDVRVAEYISNSTTMFVRDAYGRRVDDLSVVVQDVVARGVNAGLDSNAIGTAIASQVTSGQAARGLEYWRTVSSVFSARGRSYAQISAFSEAEITKYQWDGVIDGRSCSICRYMDGKVWSTTEGVEQIEKVMALDDPEKIVDASPFLRQGKDEDGKPYIYMQNSKGERRNVAEIIKSAEGQKDKIGSYREVMSHKDLTSAGVSACPAHPRCRCDLVTL